VFRVIVRLVLALGVSGVLVLPPSAALAHAPAERAAADTGIAGVAPPAFPNPAVLAVESGLFATPRRPTHGSAALLETAAGIAPAAREHPAHSDAAHPTLGGHGSSALLRGPPSLI
jgi:hypothetical protein